MSYLDGIIEEEQKSFLDKQVEPKTSFLDSIINTSKDIATGSIEEGLNVGTGGLYKEGKQFVSNVQNWFADKTPLPEERQWEESIKNPSREVGSTVYKQQAVKETETTPADMAIMAATTALPALKGAMSLGQIAKGIIGNFTYGATDIAGAGAKGVASAVKSPFKKAAQEIATQITPEEAKAILKNSKEFADSLSEHLYQNNVIPERRAVNGELDKLPRFVKKDIEANKYTIEQYKSNPDIYDKLNTKQVETGLQKDLTKLETQRPTEVITPQKAATEKNVSLNYNRIKKDRELEGQKLGWSKEKINKEIEKAWNKINGLEEEPVIKYAGESAINLEHIKVSDDTKKFIEDAAKIVQKDKPLTHKEIIDASADIEVLSKVMTRESTLKSEAALLKTREHLAALAIGNKITPEFINTLKTVSSYATNAGRELNALKIEANPILASSKVRLTKKLLDMGIEGERIIEASKNIDFNNHKQVVEFYRALVKPKLGEIIDEFRFINLLSSPKTHITNAFTNAIQVAVVRPSVRTVSTGIDVIKSALTGKQREYFLNQVPAYYQGAISSVGDSLKKALEVVRGGTDIYRPDLSMIPTNIKLLKPFQGIPRVLEAADVFFGNMATQAEYAALIKKGMSPVEAADQATKVAREVIFRKSVDTTNKSGQGTVLSTIDKLTAAVYKLREVPGVKWFVPFVQTPMNIAKQGIEYSPLGLATLAKNSNKTEQAAKAMIGSMVFGAGGWMAMEDRTTWGVPTNPKDKEAFFAAGMQPYSIKIGDKWVSYSKIGAIAYPLAMAAATKYYTKENPSSAIDTNLDKTSKVLMGIAEFFSDQSYVEGIGNIIDAARGDGKSTKKFFKMITDPASQLIPLLSLQRWVTNIVDPIYRKSSKESTVENIIDNIKKGIPGLSQTVEPVKDLEGNPSQKQYPVANAFNPMSVTKENSEFKDYYNERILGGLEQAKLTDKQNKNNKLIEKGIEEYFKTQDATKLLSLMESQELGEESKVIKKVITALRQEGIPNKYWYDNIKSLPPSIAEIIFMNRYEKSSPEIQNKMLEASAREGGIVGKVYKSNAKKQLKRQNDM